MSGAAEFFDKSERDADEETAVLAYYGSLTDLPDHSVSSCPVICGLA